MNLRKKCNSLLRRLRIKTILLPIYDLVYRKKTFERMSKYDKTSTCYGLNTEKRDFDLIVSLTTFPARIKSAAYVIDAMMRQSLKPDKIILNLANNEITTDELPQEFANLQTRGLTIVFVENLKPHNKYFYTMRKFREHIVITVDDDVLYPENLIETLYKSYALHPNCISTMRAHRILFKKGKLLPYNSWEYETAYSKSSQMDLFATGVGGVLYPPQCMDEDMYNADIIKKIALDNDDIWLKFMQLKKRTPVVLAGDGNVNLLYMPESQKTSLWSENRDNNRNDKIMRDCMRFFQIQDEELYNKIKT